MEESEGRSGKAVIRAWDGREKDNGTESACSVRCTFAIRTLKSDASHIFRKRLQRYTDMRTRTHVHSNGTCSAKDAGSGASITWHGCISDGRMMTDAKNDEGGGTAEVLDRI